MFSERRIRSPISVKKIIQDFSEECLYTECCCADTRNEVNVGLMKSVYWMMPVVEKLQLLYVRWRLKTIGENRQREKERKREREKERKREREKERKREREKERKRKRVKRVRDCLLHKRVVASLVNLTVDIQFLIEPITVVIHTSIVSKCVYHCQVSCFTRFVF